MIVDIHAHMGHHPIQDFKQEPDEILSVMEKYGISHSFILPFPSMKINSVNNAVAEFVKEQPERLIGFAVINPAEKECLEEVERIASIGLKGVMLDPEFHGIFRYQEKVEELMVPCMDNNLPILFNTLNIEVGEGSRMGREPYYNGLNSLAFKYPDIRFLVSPFWPRIKELMKAYQNIFIDSGGRNGISGAVRLATDIGPTKICFGSESPQNHPALGIKAIKTMKISPVYRELLLGKNAKRIFKDLF
jgi:predicted TIM-barrel fold metal-dependent hydrolase